MRRLDPTRPVPREDLLTILDAASRGPSGGNTQPVRWVVVTDPATKARLGALYRKIWREGIREKYVKPDLPEATQRIVSSGDHLADHFGEAPAIIAVCAGWTHRGASVYPGVQNLMIAARALGLGTTLTTVHFEEEDEFKSVLNVPDDIGIHALIPIGYPTGKWGEGPRRPLDKSVYWDSWGVRQQLSECGGRPMQAADQD